MIVGYHLFICLVLILVQTTLLAGGHPVCYDLMAPFVIYLGVCHRARQSLWILPLGGLAMDGISGGVFGVYLTAYLWLYVGVRWAIQFLHANNVILLTLLVAVGVAFESLVMAFSAVVLASVAWPVESVLSVVSRQVIWGAATGPLLMMLMVRGQKAALWVGKTYFAEKDS